MRMTIHANGYEMDAYENYMAAIANDKSEVAPIMELMLAGFREARKHPGLVDEENDGFTHTRVFVDEYGGSDLEITADTMTVVKLMEIMTKHRKTVEKVVRFVHSGLKLMEGLKGMFGEFKAAIESTKADYALRETKRTGTDG